MTTRHKSINILETESETIRAALAFLANHIKHANRFPTIEQKDRSKKEIDCLKRISDKFKD